MTQWLPMVMLVDTFWGRLALHQQQLAWVWLDTVTTILMVVTAPIVVIVQQNDVNVLKKMSNATRNVIWAVRLVKTNKFQNSFLLSQASELSSVK